MDESFSRRIKYNSYLYRYRDKLPDSSEVVEQFEHGAVENATDPQEQLSESRMDEADDVGENIHHGQAMELQGDSTSADATDEREEVVEDYLYESSDEASDDAAESFSVIDALRAWAVNHKATYESIEEVMEIIRNVSSCKLPKDARTLLKINRNPSKEILKTEGGQYWHHGVQKSLLVELRDENLNAVSKICLNVSIDGLPIFKNTNTQFWPILFSIHNLPEVPVMTAAIYCGPKKPANIECFLRPFVDELNLLTACGTYINGRKLDVELRAFIADSPARAFIKGVASFNSRAGCLKCTVQGESLCGRVAFPAHSAPVRTDEGFRQRQYGNHHRVDSPLLALQNFDIVKQVIVADSLHLIDLGVTKRMITGWMEGKFGVKKKWNDTQVSLMTAALCSIKLPVEIHRQFRSVLEYGRWKASEFASFLSYAGLVVLQTFISKEEYELFMLYFCAVTLLSTAIYKDHWPLANRFLELFVKQYAIIYGPEFVSSNIHNLLHIFSEVNEYGPLHTLSSYTFENSLQHLKRTLRCGNKSLEQVINRISEREAFLSGRKKPLEHFPYISNRRGMSTLHIRQAFCLKNTDANGWFLTKSGKVCRFEEAIIKDKKIFIQARKLYKTTDCFDYPLNSKFMHMHRGNLCNLEEDHMLVDIKDTFCKLVAISLSTIDDDSFYIPLKHTLSL